MKFEVGEICEVRNGRWYECTIIAIGDPLDLHNDCIDAGRYPDCPERPNPHKDGCEYWVTEEFALRKKQPPEACDDEFFEDFKKIILPVSVPLSERGVT